MLNFDVNCKPEIILDFKDYSKEDLFKSNKDAFKEVNYQVNHGEISLAEMYDQLGLHVPYDQKDYFEHCIFKDGKIGHYETRITFRKKIFGFIITREKVVFVEDGWCHF